MMKWFKEVFLKSFVQNRPITITMKQADVFYKYMNFKVGRGSKYGIVDGVLILISPIRNSSKYMSIIISDHKTKEEAERVALAFNA